MTLSLPQRSGPGPVRSYTATVEYGDADGFDDPDLMTACHNGWAVNATPANGPVDSQWRPKSARDGTTGTRPATLNVGENFIKLVVTAPDMTTVRTTTSR